MDGRILLNMSQCDPKEPLNILLYKHIRAIQSLQIAIQRVCSLRTTRQWCSRLSAYNIIYKTLLGSLAQVILPTSSIPYSVHFTYRYLSSYISSFILRCAVLPTLIWFSTSTITSLFNKRKLFITLSVILSIYTSKKTSCKHLRSKF